MEDTAKLLKRYNCWRRGRGKKYSQPGFPLDPTAIGVAIDDAVERIGLVANRNDLAKIAELASPLCKSSEDRHSLSSIRRVLKRMERYEQAHEDRG